MYAGLEGTISSIGLDPVTNEPHISLNVHGAHYELRCTERMLQGLKGRVGEAFQVYTHLIVREDELSLVGFASPEERDMFRILIGASGVGAKVALAILNHFETAELVQAVLNEEIKRITAVKGVGPKMAQRIVLDVKEKLKTFAERSRLGPASAGASGGAATPANAQALEEALMVLDSLGYEAAEVDVALQAVRAKHTPETLATFDAETLLRELLQRV